MSSPFAKKFMGSALAKTLKGGQVNLPEHLQEAIKASPLNDKLPGDSHPHDAKGEHKRGSSPAEMNESPLYNHGDKHLKKAKKLSLEGGEDGDYDYENKEVMSLVDKGNAKNASHDKKEKKEPQEKKTQVR